MLIVSGHSPKKGKKMKIVNDMTVSKLETQFNNSS